MNRKDRDNMLILGTLLSFIILFLFFNFITKKMYFIVIAGIIMCIQTFVIIPFICKYYYEVNKFEIGLSRFIPFYQELTIFPKPLANILACMWIGAAILFMIITLGSKSGLIGTIFGLEIIVNIEQSFGDILANLLAIIIIVSNFMIGAGFTQVRKDVNRIDIEFSGYVKKRSAVELLYYVLLYIPIMRVVPLCNIWNTLLKLVKLNKYKPVSEMDTLYEED